MTTALKYANASRVTTNLWIGGDLDTQHPAIASKQLEELEEAGITDILDCRIEWDDQSWVRANKPHIGYLWLGVDDAGQRMPDAWFDRGVVHALERLAAGGTVLVHCHMGINRGPSMGFAIMLALGWDPIEALDRIRERRPIAAAGYAEDALDWWLRKHGSNRTKRDEERTRLLRRRRENDLDVAGIIRRLRRTSELTLDLPTAFADVFVTQAAGERKSESPGLISIGQIVETYGVARKTVMRWIQAGKIVPALTLPGRTGAHLFRTEEAHAAFACWPAR